jgi:hypothetical protein
MRRATTLVLAVTAVLAPAATATAGQQTTGPTFDLPASNGFTARVERDINHRITLWIGNRNQINGYTVPAKSTPDHLEARFGKLGRISFDFKPTRTVRVTPPPAGCRGGPERLVEGVFTGSAHFHGERGYTTIDAARVKGQEEYLPELTCSFRAGRVSGREHRPPSPFSGLDKLERESEIGHVAVLQAKGNQHELAAIATSPPKAQAKSAAYFFAAVEERRKHLRISRVAAVKAPPAAFTFDHEAGTATLTPPAPFTGTATFQRTGKEAKTWTGSLAVSLLGAAPIRLAGPKFESSLAPDFRE